MQTIIVGYDHTDPSKRALERAAQIAKPFSAKVIVTSVAPLLHSSPRSAAVGPAAPVDSLTHHEEELAQAKLQAGITESRVFAPYHTPRRRRIRIGVSL